MRWWGIGRERAFLPRR
ncbi:hypothetical protein E2C01_094738 [Portunus trituberculatus]|uniref:Uncharacterized protein n=1 Tax=Portunus trituberculatus TaxID=210409 RepID=A0A5B7JMY7_PORTR|nr:hypothetical protein [Portunus trituberculatus]